MNTLWIVKGEVEGGTLYLKDYTDSTKENLVGKIMMRAFSPNERFSGTIEERLEQLGWELVEVEFKEIE